jgi:hypothetical protein
MKILKRHELLNKIRSQNGRFFTIAFIKADGTPRVMNGRTGVKRYANGKNKIVLFNSKHPNLINMYDVQNSDYRFANLKTVIGLNAEGATFIIV